MSPPSQGDGSSQFHMEQMLQGNNLFPHPIIFHIFEGHPDDIHRKGGVIFEKGIKL